MFSFGRIRKQDPVVLGLTLLISLFGLVSVFTTTFFPEMGVSNDFIQQIFFIALGLIFYLFLISIDTKFLSQGRIQILLGIGTIFILIALLIWGDPVSGTKRWLEIGDLRLQPSEFAKLIIITSTAATFTHINKIDIQSIRSIYNNRRTSRLKLIIRNEIFLKFLLNIFFVLSVVLLIQQQPSLGNALLSFGLWIMMLSTLIGKPWSIYVYLFILFVSTNLILQLANFSQLYSDLGIYPSFDPLLLIASIGVIFFLLKAFKLNATIVLMLVIFGILGALSVNYLWNNTLQDYQKDRITSFLESDTDPLGSDWQVNQSQIAISSGQITGRGLLQGSQTNSGLLPFAYTDFAYASFSEQFGLVGSFLLLLCLYFLIFRIFQISRISRDNFGKILCIGVGIMLSLNVIVNVGMNLGLLPVTGVPLPLISYGGSSILVNLIGIGLVQMVYVEQNSGDPHFEKLNFPDKLLK